jgi:hypothetical protein
VRHRGAPVPYHDRVAHSHSGGERLPLAGRREIAFRLNLESRNDPDVVCVRRDLERDPGGLKMKVRLAALVLSGLSVIAITDHNEIGNVEAGIQAAGTDLLVVPGVELSTPQGHLLCYLPDLEARYPRSSLSSGVSTANSSTTCWKSPPPIDFSVRTWMPFWPTVVLSPSPDRASETASREQSGSSRSQRRNASASEPDPRSSVPDFLPPPGRDSTPHVPAAPRIARRYRPGVRWRTRESFRASRNAARPRPGPHAEPNSDPPTRSRERLLTDREYWRVADRYSASNRRPSLSGDAGSIIFAAALRC